MNAGEDVPIIAIVGPTASGKSDLAVQIAARISGEVVNADSMQIYCGMDIGTAKLAPAERRGVPHHLLDLYDVTRPATVAEFQHLARRAIDDCRRRDVVPVLVGGSALYVRAILDRFEFPGTVPEVRARLEAERAEIGTATLHTRLSERDPKAAAAISPTNARRVVRALEVIEITGGPFTASLPPRRSVYDAVVQIGLDVPRDVLAERIDVRVRKMWDQGFVDEVRRLEAQGLRQGPTASRALGYAQILDFLAAECAVSSEGDAFDETVRATRRFARRQHSWFGKDERITWLPFDATDLLERALFYHRRP